MKFNETICCEHIESLPTKQNNSIDHKIRLIIEFKFLTHKVHLKRN